MSTWFPFFQVIIFAGLLFTAAAFRILHKHPHHYGALYSKFILPAVFGIVYLFPASDWHTASIITTVIGLLITLKTQPQTSKVPVLLVYSTMLLFTILDMLFQTSFVLSGLMVNAIGLLVLLGEGWRESFEILSHTSAATQ